MQEYSVWNAQVEGAIEEQNALQQMLFAGARLTARLQLKTVDGNRTRDCM